MNFGSSLDKASVCLGLCCSYLSLIKTFAVFVAFEYHKDNYIDSTSKTWEHIVSLILYVIRLQWIIERRI